MKIIDSHQHVFWHGRNDADLAADMDRYGIQTAWLLSWEIHPLEDSPRYHGILNPEHLRADGTHAGIPLSDLIRAHNRHPNRFLVGYCPHPLHPCASSLLEAAIQIHGVRVCGEWKFRLPFDDPRCLEIFRVAGHWGLPVVLHLDVPYLKDVQGRLVYQKNWYGGTVENLVRALRACPQTNFIGHAPGFWREISGDAANDPSIYPDGPVQPDGLLAELLTNHSNLFADLSADSALTALKRDLKHAREFILKFSDRLLFGRDFYGGELMTTLNSFRLPKKVRTQIYCENAERLAAPARQTGVAPSGF